MAPPLSSLVIGAIGHWGLSVELGGGWGMGSGSANVLCDGACASVLCDGACASVQVIINKYGCVLCVS